MANRIVNTDFMFFILDELLIYKAKLGRIVEVIKWFKLVLTVFNFFLIVCETLGNTPLSIDS